jgi:hypothetical protein
VFQNNIKQRKLQALRTLQGSILLSHQQELMNNMKRTLTQLTLMVLSLFLFYSFANIPLALNPHLLNALPSLYAPYMNSTMSEEQVEEFMTSFISDRRIPSATRFNLCQTMLKLYNAGGGNALTSHWNYPSEHPDLPKVVIDGVDIVCLNHLALVFPAYICVIVTDSLKRGGQIF